MRYVPNLAHKRETTEVGPPRWNPSKTPCPTLSLDERNRLFGESIPEDLETLGSTRYAMRVGSNGYEWFVGRLTRFTPDGEPEFHGYPTFHVPPRVLRRFRDLGRISDADYRRLVKEIG